MRPALPGYFARSPARALRMAEFSCERFCHECLVVTGGRSARISAKKQAGNYFIMIIPLTGS
jgi:hypothetical protein